MQSDILSAGHGPPNRLMSTAGKADKQEDIWCTNRHLPKRGDVYFRLQWNVHGKTAEYNMPAYKVEQVS